MTTPRFLDNDGLDGILPAETASSPYQYLIWVGIVVILLAITLMLFLYSSRGTDVETSLSPPALEKIKLADTQIGKISAVSSQNKAKINSISNKNLTTDSKNAAFKGNDVSPSIDLSNKKISLKRNTTIVDYHSAPIQPNVLEYKANQVKEKEIAIKPSHTYVFELSAKKIEFIAAGDASSLTDFIQQCNNGIEIVGHTCNQGPGSFNYQLGLARATAMQLYLIGQGANPDNLKISSKGMDQPIASNATLSGRKLNRRVELLCITD